MQFIDNLLKKMAKGLWRWFVRKLKGSDTSKTPSSPMETHNKEQSTTPEFTERRRFLNQVSIALSGVIAALIGIPFISFLFASEREEKGQIWQPIGTLEDFPIGETVKVTFFDPRPLPWAGFSARAAAWVRQEEADQFIALSIYCTHVGCPVRWAEEAQLFLCPCHGGSFYRNGAVAGGPPTEALDRYNVRVRNGEVELLAQPQPLPADAQS
jgi:menaquinol-cytochrome c reductase iron-sulfur subunit